MCETARSRSCRSVSKLALFFSPGPYRHPWRPAEPRRESETSKDGLIEPPGNLLHFISRRGPRSRIFIAHRAVNACRFSRVFRISTTTTVGRASESPNIDTHVRVMFLLFVFPPSLAAPFPFFSHSHTCSLFKC